MVKNFIHVLFLVFIIFSSLQSQTINARAFTDKKGYEVGDYITYTIEISHNQNLKVYKPALSELVKDVEVIQNEEPVVEETNGNKKIIYRYVISKYDSADVDIPSIPITYQLGNDSTSFQVFTNPVQFAVRTIPVIQAAEIKDVKPPIVIPMDILSILLMLVVIIAIVLLAVYYYRKNQKKKQRLSQRKKVYIIPPHIKALSELHALEEKKLWQQGLIKEYHTGVTEIIRRYFEDRFKILALESSTTEIMEQLTRVILSENIYKTVTGFLNNADLVKFAKYEPLPSVNEEMMRQAVDIVENTVPVKFDNSSREKVNVK